MKRIGVDARLYFQTGVGVYLRNFLHYLQFLDTKTVEFYIYVLQEDSENIHFERSNFVKRAVTFRWHTFGEQSGFLSTLYQDNLDLMHFTYFSYPIFYTRKFMATIHDTILLHHKSGKASTKNPLLYELKYQVAKLAFSTQLRNARAIITPSKTVKNELAEKFGSQYISKIYPIYEGVNYELIETKEKPFLSDKLKKQEYFIYVGNFYPHKNVERLIRAFAQIKTDKKLVLAGSADFFMKRLEHLVTALHLDERVFFTHQLTIHELKYLYKNALAVIHPSLSEGFCLPLVEAAYCKVPIIASDIPIFREIIGTKYTAFDPLSEFSISAAIESFLTEKKHVIPEIIPDFSFKVMASNILQLYETV